MSELKVFTEDQRDCLQEIVNIAMGSAGDSLARVVETFVRLSIPKIRTIRPNDMASALVSLSSSDSDTVSAVRQSFQCDKGQDGLRGEALVVFSEESFQDLAELMAYEEILTPEAEQELLLDVSNILNGACLNGIASQLSTSLSYSPPSILGQGMPVEELVQREALTWDQALSVEINYSLENRSFSCDLLLLMPGSSIDYLCIKLEELLEED